MRYRRYLQHNLQGAVHVDSLVQLACQWIKKLLTVKYVGREGIRREALGIGF